MRDYYNPKKGKRGKEERKKEGGEKKSKKRSFLEGETKVLKRWKREAASREKERG